MVLAYNSPLTSSSRRSAGKQPGTQIKCATEPQSYRRMSLTLTNPLRLTNVSIVRLKKGGKRFEVSFSPPAPSAFVRN